MFLILFIDFKDLFPDDVSGDIRLFSVIDVLYLEQEVADLLAGLDKPSKIYDLPNALRKSLLVNSFMKILKKLDHYADDDNKLEKYRKNLEDRYSEYALNRHLYGGLRSYLRHCRDKFENFLKEEENINQKQAVEELRAFSKMSEMAIVDKIFEMLRSCSIH